MGGFSIWHWLIVIAVAAVLFGGRGKITNVMGDFAKGIKAFKSGLKEEETAAAAAAATPTPAPQVTPPASPVHPAGERPVHDRG